jgi:Family of unknown function (DUF5662)
MYDSRVSTYEHIKVVSGYIHEVVINLLNRARVHDDSKLVSPEVEVFDEFTPKLKDSTYGSVEYERFLKEMKVALDHHYANNSHHPEHKKERIKGMSLLDIVEMLVDWKAATLRHADGDLLKSIEINQKRFGYTDELKMILINTVKELGL